MELVLKIAAATFSALYGFYATITDFRVEKHGKKALSSKGYIGLALLALATVISISSDRFKEDLDRKAADAAKYELDTITKQMNYAAGSLKSATADLGKQLD